MGTYSRVLVSVKQGNFKRITKQGVTNLFCLEETKQSAKSSIKNIKVHLQYCAKVMRVNFDEFCLLFSRIFDDKSAKFCLVFRVAQCDISKKMWQNYASPFEISK